MGVIKSSDLRDAEDFDVIGEVERKAETVKQNALEKENNKETEGEPNDKRSTEEVLANVGKTSVTLSGALQAELRILAFTADISARMFQ